MYQSDFLCTYKKMESDTDKDELYQIQLLQAFDINSWDDIVVNNTVSELYKLMLHDKSLQEILLKLSEREEIQMLINMNLDSSDVNFERELFIFSLLFQYNLFDLFHNCIIDFMRSGKIEDKSSTALLNVLI